MADAPDCVCFADNAVWDPPTPATSSAAGLLSVAESTAAPIPAVPGGMGVNESCLPSGGKPFWMMQEGFTDSMDAIDQADSEPTFWAAADRQAWCSETVSFWHREAELPFAGGYQRYFFPTWQLEGSRLIREWYTTVGELERGNPIKHAVWLNDTELDLNGTFGVDLPCPGNYQRISKFTYDPQNDTTGDGGTWSGVHSNVVYSVTRYINQHGRVFDLEITTIDGNSNNNTRVSPKVWSVRTDLQHGSAPRVDGRRYIDGWGIDYEYDGATSTKPSCDFSRIATVHMVGPDDWVPSSAVEPQSFPWLPFATDVQTYGLSLNIDGASSTVDELPLRVLGQPWIIPANDFADGVAEVLITWPRDMPWQVDSLTMYVDQDDLTSLQVDVLDANQTLLTTESATTDLASSRIDVQLVAAATPRSVRLTFERPSTVTTDFELQELSIHLAEIDDDADVNP